MSLTLPTLHTDGAVQTEPPPIQNTHPAHTATHRIDVGRCIVGFKLNCCGKHSANIWIFLQSEKSVILASSLGIKAATLVSDNQNR